MPLEVLPMIITGASGLLGVAVGGYFATHNQKRERQQRHVSEALSEFYGPMLALRAHVLAKGELRLKISGIADVAWRERMEEAREESIEELRQTREERFPLFEKIIAENNRGLAEDIMPMYRKMLELFTSKMHLAHPSTLQYFAALLEFVEVWERWLDGSLPGEVLAKLDHSENTLYPFYLNVAALFGRMQHLLTEEHSWLRRRHPATVKVLPLDSE